jgi:hypothetical protein
MFAFSLIQGYSQTKGISYQAVILNPNEQEIPGENAQGNILANSAVVIQFTIVNAANNQEYQEYHATSTDRYGMVNILIGSGTITSSNDFSDIVWGGTVKKLKVAIDFSGNGSNFTPLSEQNLSYMPQPLNDFDGQLISNNTADIATNTAAILLKEDTANKSTDVATDGASDTKYPSVKAVKTYMDGIAINGSPVIASNTLAITTNTTNITTNATDILSNVNDIAANAASLLLKEDTGNKSTNVITDAASDVKYPSVKAVKSYVDATVSNATIADADTTTKGKIKLAGDLSGTADAPTVPGLTGKVDKVTDSSLIEDSSIARLADTRGLNTGDQDLSGKENTANKSTDVELGTSDVLFPTQKAVKAYVDNTVSSGAVDATATIKGIIQLAGDLAGTAAVPTVPGLTGKEDVANKSTNVAADAASDTKYPSVNAIKTYVDANISIGSPATLSNTANISTNTTNINANTSAILLKEDVANKSTNVAADALLDTKYPSVKAIKTYVDAATANNANLSGVITSVGNLTTPTSQTGTGTKFVMDTSPVLVTPNIGTPSAGVATNLTGLPLTTGVTGALPIANGGTGATTKAAAFDALSPITAAGDLIYGDANGVSIKLPPGTVDQVLTMNIGATAPEWKTAAQSGWLIAGNTGTVDGTNFIGTTDDQPFNIRVNNQKAGRIDRGSSNTFFGYMTGNSTIANLSTGTGTGNTASGHQALFFNTAGRGNTANGSQALYFTTTGVGNTASGINALRANIGGDYNTANGGWTLSSNTIGTKNTASGMQALQANTAGSNNTANGYEALRFNQGSDNTASGMHALYDNITGNQNTAIGFAAGFFNISGIGNIFIGHRAGYNETGSEKLYIDNSDTTSPLIYGDFATDALTINGDLNLKDGTSAGNLSIYEASGSGTNKVTIQTPALVADYTLTLPVGDGTVNQVLTTDGAGATSWVTNTAATNIDGLSDGKTLNTSVYLGENSGLSDFIGNRNTALGSNTLKLSQASKENTAIGAEALSKNIGDGNSYPNSNGQNTAVGAFALQENTVGIQNIAIGVNSLQNNISGSTNIAIGYNTMIDNTTGNQNVAVGSIALTKNNTGTNTTIGEQSLLNTTGQGNVAIGFASGGSNSSGSNNVFLGKSAGPTSGSSTEELAAKIASNKLYIDNSQSLTPLIYGDFATDALTINGDLNLKDGTSAGNLSIYEASGSGTNKVTIQTPALVADYTLTLPVDDGTVNQVLTTDGAGATSWVTNSAATTLDGLTDAKSGGDNFTGSLIIGHESTGTLNTASNNTGVGYGALQAITTGDDNTAIGYGALQANTTGPYNTAIGKEALKSNTEGNQNTAIGMQALTNNTVGFFNTAIGMQALNNTTTGDENTAIGYTALFNNKAGNNATAIGSRAMQRSNSTTSNFINNNVAVGYEALMGSINATVNTGTFNTAVGYQTLSNNTSGSYNTAIGNLALNANNAGSFNTALGRDALKSNISGSQNVVVGSSAGSANTSGDRNIFLGNSAGFNETGSDKLYIEPTNSATPLIYGEFNTNLVRINGQLQVTGVLEVTGAATNTVALNFGNNTSINFALSNIAYTNTTSATITLNGLKNGGAYTLACTATMVSNEVTFTAAGFTFRAMGTAARTNGKVHLYSFIVAGTQVYVSMATEN